jgi:hypothetical protein
MVRRTHVKALRYALMSASMILRRYGRSQLAKAIHAKISSGGCDSFVLGLSLVDDPWMRRTWRIKSAGVWDGLLG